ncbi:MAG: hypothetical protein LUI14_05160 [Lachnospiraceae bacterium]|nr:hypothetical protein [Lachnospiraceae bacterium]
MKISKDVVDALTASMKWDGNRLPRKREFASSVMYRAAEGVIGYGNDPSALWH